MSRGRSMLQMISSHFHSSQLWTTMRISKGFSMDMHADLVTGAYECDHETSPCGHMNASQKNKKHSSVISQTL